MTLAARVESYRLGGMALAALSQVPARGRRSGAHRHREPGLRSDAACPLRPGPSRPGRRSDRAREAVDSFIALAAAEVQSAAGVAPHRRPYQHTGMASQEKRSDSTQRPGPANDELSGALIFDHRRLARHPGKPATRPCSRIPSARSSGTRLHVSPLPGTDSLQLADSNFPTNNLVRCREHRIYRRPDQSHRPRLRPMISFMISVVPPKNHTENP
jgi:hypothetical protein